MKINDILDIMKANKVHMPQVGTGRHGKVLAKDLEDALGDHFLKSKYLEHSAEARREILEHLKLRRQMEPMKSFRYDKLKSSEQNFIMVDNSAWSVTEKFNGWRGVLTYRPASGFRVWGGNTSTKDFLPVDYTEHVLGARLKKMNDQLYKAKTRVAFVLDVEMMCYSDVELLDGTFTNNTLDAVGAILGSSPARAVELQTNIFQHEVVFQVFDCVKTSVDDLQKLNFDADASQRELFMGYMFNKFCWTHSSQFNQVLGINLNKQQFLNNIWKEGGEGVVARHKQSLYAPGKRLRDTSVKIKRTMSGEIGDDLDAYICGYVETPEWSKRGLIGGLKLAVMLYDEDQPNVKEEYHIATVTAMSDSVREELTLRDESAAFKLRPCYWHKVLVVDGMELSNRNKKLMHAKVDWTRGFRKDKSYKDCTLNRNYIEGDKF